MAAAENTSAFGFVKPQEYVKSNQTHQDLNKDVIKSIIDCFGELNEQDVIVDFGCGTGETTALMARGKILSKSMSHHVIGMDISKAMIEHCKKTYKSSSSDGNLQFFHFDYTDSEMVQDFQSRWMGKVKLITCFNVMHWVEDQARALEFMRNILLPNGRGILAISILLRHNSKHIIRRAFEALKQDATSVLFDVLKYIKYKHDNFKFDKGTNITVDYQVSDEAYLELLATHEFEVKKHELKPITFKVSKAFADNIFSSIVLPSHAEETKNFQDLFREEFSKKVLELQNQEKYDNDLIPYYFDGFIAFATT